MFGTSQVFHNFRKFLVGPSELPHTKFTSYQSLFHYLRRSPVLHLPKLPAPNIRCTLLFGSRKFVSWLNEYEIWFPSKTDEPHPSPSLFPSDLFPPFNIRSGISDVEFYRILSRGGPGGPDWRHPSHVPQPRPRSHLNQNPSGSSHNENHRGFSGVVKTFCKKWWLLWLPKVSSSIVQTKQNHIQTRHIFFLLP